MIDAADQLLREWPPGYGGVERVVHELASVWGGTVYSFDVQARSNNEDDALPVGYGRRVLPCSFSFGAHGHSFALSRALVHALVQAPPPWPPAVTWGFAGSNAARAWFIRAVG